MSLVLHHFRKEARYLLPRWLPWLGLLIFQLAVQLEWLFPLEENLPPGIAQLHWIVWAVAGWLTLLHAPEDRPSDHQGFTAARPLRPRQYWAARTLTFLIMIVLPLALQEAIYLLLSQRPLPEVAAGAAQRCFMAIACLAWLLPLTGLFRGVQLLAILVILYPLCTLAIQFREWSYRLSKIYPPPASHLLLPSFVFPVMLLFTVLLVALLVRHKQRFLSFTHRFGITIVLSIVLTWLTLHWSYVGKQVTPENQPLAEQAQQRTQIEFRFDSLAVSRSLSPGQPPLLLALQNPAFRFPGDGLCASVRQHVSSVTQNEKVFTPKNRQKASPYPLATYLWSSLQPNFLDFGLAAQFPSTTIFPDGSGQGDEIVSFGFDSSDLPDLHQPLRWEKQYHLDWVQWHKIVDLSLTEGATASSPYANWQILKVSHHTGADGQPAKGLVTVTYRVEWQPQEMDLRPGSAAVALHSPDGKLAWMKNASSYGEPTKMTTPRGAFSAWRRQVITSTWKNVLTYPDDSLIALDPSQLRLLAFKPDYLGTTNWSFRSPTFRIADHLTPSDQGQGWSMLGSSSIYRGNELQAFRDRMAVIPPIQADSSAQQVSRYLFETLAAVRVTGVLSLKNEQANQEVEKALRPLATYHLEALLAIPSRAIPNETFSGIVASFLTDEHKPLILPRLVSSPWLIEVAEKRGWDKEALPLLKTELKHPAPLDFRLVKWLQKSNDLELLSRLATDIELRPWGYYSHQGMRRLAGVPLFHDRLKASAQKAWREDFQPGQNELLSAILFGDRDALDVSIRLAQFGETPRSSSPTWTDPRLSELLQLPKRGPDEDPKITTELFRKLSSMDFEFNPQQRRWAKKQP